jgi:hypothetical protein
MPDFLLFVKLIYNRMLIGELVHTEHGELTYDHNMYKII